MTGGSLVVLVLAVQECKSSLLVLCLSNHCLLFAFTEKYLYLLFITCSLRQLVQINLTKYLRTRAAEKTSVTTVCKCNKCPFERLNKVFFTRAYCTNQNLNHHLHLYLPPLRQTLPRLIRHRRRRKLVCAAWKAKS